MEVLKAQAAAKCAEQLKVEPWAGGGVQGQAKGPGLLGYTVGELPRQCYLSRFV